MNKKLKTLWSSTLAACAMTLASQGVSAQSHDQQYVPNVANTGYDFTARDVSGPFGPSTPWIGQTLTAGVSGQLARIDLAVWRDARYDTGLDLSVFAYDVASQALGDKLGSVLITSVPASSSDAFVPVPPDRSNPFGLFVDTSSLGINMVAGQSYAITLVPTAKLPATGNVAVGINWIGSNASDQSNLYAGGYRIGGVLYPLDGPIPGGGPLGSATRVTVDAAVDLAFKTYVTTVPEPGSTWLMVVGLTAVGMAGARRRSA